MMADHFVDVTKVVHGGTMAKWSPFLNSPAKPPPSP
jgi:hypothetical protein